jgi:selenium metabolism protein YedF
MKDVINCKGLACPQPVIRVKELLEQGVEDLEVLVDNEAASTNIQRFAHSKGCTVLMKQERETEFRLLIRVPQGGLAKVTQENMQDGLCTPSTHGKLVYVISSDAMGRGSEELGWALMQTYVQTIAQISPLPDTIVLYNSGVRLVTQESGALQALRTLQAKGVEVLVCGTCLDFYELKSALQVGQISNMFAIMHITMQASKLMSPL